MCPLNLWNSLYRFNRINYVMIMENFDTNELDARTMRLAVDVAATGSVSAAALRVGLSQSTASYRLEKLRRYASDPVFVRGKSGMEPTALGEVLIQTFRQVLGQLDALSDVVGFDPATATRDFHIAAAAPEIEAVLGPLYRHLAQEAPHCRLIPHALSTEDLPRDLQEKWDLALLSEPPNSGVLKRTHLFTDRYVTFFDASVRDAPDTLAAFCAADHAVASLGSAARTAVDRALRKANRQRDVKLVVSNIEALAPFMKGSALVTTIPASLSQGLMREFAFIECPVVLEPIPFHAVWHMRKDADAANRWLRGQIRQMMNALRR